MVIRDDMLTADDFKELGANWEGRTRALRVRSEVHEIVEAEERKAFGNRFTTTSWSSRRYRVGRYLI